MEIQKNTKIKIKKAFGFITSSLSFISLINDNKKLKTSVVVGHAINNLIDFIPCKKGASIPQERNFIGGRYYLSDFVKDDNLSQKFINSLMTSGLEIIKDQDNENQLYIIDGDLCFDIYQNIYVSIITKTFDKNESKNIIINYLRNVFEKNFFDSNVFVIDHSNYKFSINKYEIDIPNYQFNSVNDIYDDVKKCIDNNMKRSFMFYGNPGCGKSLAIKYILARLQSDMKNKRIFYVSGRAFDNASRNLIEMIKLMNVNFVIIDDFDRTNNTTQMLTEMEEIKKYVDLFIVSVNNIDKLDPAVKRAGRIDQVIDFNNVIDKQALVDNLQLEKDSDLYKKVSSLSVAGITEFSNRIRIYGLEKSEKMISDLLSR